MIVIHPRIYPFVWPDRTRTVEAFRVVDGRVVAMGSETTVLRERVPGEAVHRPDAACILPGLIDTHAHLSSLGARPGSLDVPDESTPAEIAAHVRRAVVGMPQGSWLTGRAWNQAVWPDGCEVERTPAGFPTHRSLTEASPATPVMLHRTDQHAVWLNRAAMEAAGLWRTRVPDPEGGTVDRDADGFPSGVLVDEAVGLVRKAMPPVTPTERGLVVLERARKFLEAGVTCVHCALVKPSALPEYRNAVLGPDATGLRVRAMMYDHPEKLAEWARHNSPALGDDGVFHMVTLKAFADGALGSRGAWMYEPYVGTDGVGKPVATPPEVELLARTAVERGWQLATHAIGDRALREVMEAYVRGGWNASLEPTLRFRIEHVQHTRPVDLDRMAELRIAAPMQPIHATRDMRYCDALIGRERGANSYPWAGVLRRGIRLGFGSDYPIETLNPWAGLHAAVTRQDDRDLPAGGWNPEQCISMTQALDAYLASGASLVVADDGVLGSLATTGDFIAIDTDPFVDSARTVAGTTVRATVVGGVVRHGGL